MAESGLPRINIPPPTAEVGDEPLTPVGRVFLHPEFDCVCNWVIGVENHMDVESIKIALQHCLPVAPPLFSSRLVRCGGMDYWRKTEVDLDRHVIVVDSTNPTEDPDTTINEYVGRLSILAPLSMDKPLWELHVMPALRCAVFRFHHALGDGTSIMALLMAGCDRTAAAMSQTSRIHDGPKKAGILRVLCLSLTSKFINSLFHISKLLQAVLGRHRSSVLSSSEAVRFMPRKVATAKFLMEDFKVVKEAIPKATINDVLMGVISAGLSTYFYKCSERGMEENLQLTATSMVNMRNQGGLLELAELMNGDPEKRWGNMIASIFLPVECCKEVANPLDYVRRMKVTTDAKKNSLEAQFMFMIGNFVVSVFGVEFAISCLKAYACCASITISNLMGPKEELSILGNRIKFIRENTSGFVQPLIMHFASYAGTAEMQITVAKDIIPDPQLLAECYENSLLEMKEAAVLLGRGSDI